MTMRAISYGAVELKQAAHRYWMTGFGLSVAIHLCIVVTSFLTGVADVKTTSPSRPTNGSGLIDVQVNLTPIVPQNPGIVPRAAQGREMIPKGALGTPEPVADNPSTLEQTIMEQDEMGQQAEPQDGTVGGGGIAPGLEDNEEPPPFLPVQKEPVPLERVAPVYPEVAIKAELEGDVWVRMWVDRNGRVRKAEVVKSSCDIFNEAALEAARRWVFTPAYMNNGPVSVWVAIPFRFNLRDGTH